MAAAATLGYHPYAEDAGIYLSSLNYTLNPALYAASRPFLLAYAHLTLFPELLALIVRALHLPVAWVLLLLHLGLLWLLIISVRALAVRCFTQPPVQWAAVAITALALGTPVAGTALCIADPYLTPRSFATPLCLLLFTAVLDRRPRRALLLLAATLCLHPLMGLYGAFFALVLWTTSTRRIHGTLRVCLAAVLIALLAALSQQHVTESPAYIHAALTRTYFYLQEWQWYELIGVFAPLILLLLIYRADRVRQTSDAANCTALSAAAAACGLTVLFISALLIHPAGHSHLLARLQPVRTFHTIYVVLFLLFAGKCAERVRQRLPGRYFAAVMAVFLLLLAGSMTLVQRHIFSGSAHLEMPYRAPQNAWEQAFVWARDNTPQDALFALDATYITQPGEDGQHFRALSQRSALPDYSKDGGGAAIFPQLATQWQSGMTLSTGLSQLSDRERIARLAPAGVSWIVLQQRLQTGDAVTHFDCPYRNTVVMVCRLPRS